MSVHVQQNPISARNLLALAFVVIAFIAIACSSSTAPEPTATPTPVPTATPELELPISPELDVEAFEELNPRPELRSIDRSIDRGFDETETLPRDAINPVYSPKFAKPAEVAELMIENELIMGLNIDGDVRAYPVGIMKFREMVNDVVGGVPLLVTW